MSCYLSYITQYIGISLITVFVDELPDMLPANHLGIVRQRQADCYEAPAKLDFWVNEDVGLSNTRVTPELFISIAEKNVFFRALMINILLTH